MINPYRLPENEFDRSWVEVFELMARGRHLQLFELIVMYPRVNNGLLVNSLLIKAMGYPKATQMLADLRNMGALIEMVRLDTPAPLNPSILCPNIAHYKYLGWHNNLGTTDGYYKVMRQITPYPMPLPS